MITEKVEYRLKDITLEIPASCDLHEKAEISVINKKGYKPVVRLTDKDVKPIKGIITIVTDNVLNVDKRKALINKHYVEFTQEEFDKLFVDKETRLKLDDEPFYVCVKAEYFSSYKTLIRLLCKAREFYDNNINIALHGYVPNEQFGDTLNYIDLLLIDAYDCQLDAVGCQRPIASLISDNIYSRLSSIEKKPSLAVLSNNGVLNYGDHTKLFGLGANYIAYHNPENFDEIVEDLSDQLTDVMFLCGKKNIDDFVGQVDYNIALDD